MNSFFHKKIIFIALYLLAIVSTASAIDTNGKFMVHLQKSDIPFRDYKINEEAFGLAHGDHYYLIKDGVTYYEYDRVVQLY